MAKGTNNIWWDVNTNEGNWWNDWTGGSYSIEGISGSVDPFPLGEPVVVPEFSKYISISILCLAISIVVIPFVGKRKDK